MSALHDYAQVFEANGQRHIIYWPMISFLVESTEYHRALYEDGIHRLALEMGSPLSNLESLRRAWTQTKLLRLQRLVDTMTTVEPLRRELYQLIADNVLYRQKLRKESQRESRRIQRQIGFTVDRAKFLVGAARLTRDLSGEIIIAAIPVAGIASKGVRAALMAEAAMFKGLAKAQDEPEEKASVFATTTGTSFVAQYLGLKVSQKYGDLAGFAIQFGTETGGESVISYVRGEDFLRHYSIWTAGEGFALMLEEALAKHPILGIPIKAVLDVSKDRGVDAVKAFAEPDIDVKKPPANPAPKYYDPTGRSDWSNVLRGCSRATAVAMSCQIAHERLVDSCLEPVILN